MRIIDLNNPAVQAESFTPPPEKCAAGNPAQMIWNHYTDAAGLFSCGIWQGEDCTLNVQYGPHEEEFCVLLEGEVTLTGSEGEAQHFKAGDAFVVPGGFSGTWQNRGRVRKYYAIMLIRDPDHD
ncbi:cupin domain-containing protein [Massilia sp. W12]|uniref:cupin domain-containing protein n=1 Tax=Massilia sp. W12 TaxID=3126507 RepID=UPI0030CA7D71